MGAIIKDNGIWGKQYIIKFTLFCRQNILSIENKNITTYKIFLYLIICMEIHLQLMDIELFGSTESLPKHSTKTV